MGAACIKALGGEEIDMAADRERKAMEKKLKKSEKKRAKQEEQRNAVNPAGMASERRKIAKPGAAAAGITSERVKSHRAKSPSGALSERKLNSEKKSSSATENNNSTPDPDNPTAAKATETTGNGTESFKLRSGKSAKQRGPRKIKEYGSDLQHKPLIHAQINNSNNDKREEEKVSAAAAAAASADPRDEALASGKLRKNKAEKDEEKGKKRERDPSAGASFVDPAELDGKPIGAAATFDNNNINSLRSSVKGGKLPPLKGKLPNLISPP
jgi:hypothetical protein